MILYETKDIYWCLISLGGDETCKKNSNKIRVSHYIYRWEQIESLKRA